ncbi:MAG: ribonuclease PH [Myxococcales bacterium]|nr:ribonuclease PH [Myxococcales bacterium]
MRPDGRTPTELRTITITPDYLRDPEGSALVCAGNTWVLCTASVDEKVPSWMRAQNPKGQSGWVTAEYAMLPRATSTRSGRGPSGRGKEIERLIGRALRAAIDLDKLGPRTITVDCDVLQADGGTRTAAITGGFVALAIACRRIMAAHKIKDPIREAVAAVSVGIIDGEARLDLPYLEDVAAEVDMNVVMTGRGRLVEVQGTGERGTFDRGQLDAMCDLAARGIGELFEHQRRAIMAARFSGGAQDKR